MKTKNIFSSLLVAGMVWINLSSCSDFLAEDPQSQFSADTYLTGEEALKAGLVGAFSTMRVFYTVGTNTPLFITVLGTDEIMYRSTNNIRIFVDRYTFTSTEACILGYWKQYYRLVTRANTVITKGHEITDISESRKRLYVGNARFLRAWAYFHLVQVYGAVPLMKDHVEEFDYSVGRSPVRDVYGLIIEDLNYCIADGVLPVEIKDGYANHWAAKALLGKVYLTMASAKVADRVDGYRDIPESAGELYGKALEVLGDIIDNSGRELLPVYGDVFMIENKNKNLESLWEIQFSKQEPYGSQWSKEYGAFASGYNSEDLTGGWRANGYAGSCTQNFVPSFRNYYMKYGVSANGRSDKTYDTRRTWNLADSIIMFDRDTNRPTQARAITGLAGNPVLGDNTSTRTIQFSGITKYRWGKSWRTEDVITDFVYSNCPNNIIALRFADVLLMYAEADLGDDGTVTPAGLAAINRIVQRARGLKADGTPVPESETPGFENYTGYTVDDILMERARELCFEWWRWFDLARTGSFENFLAEREAAEPAQTGFNPDRHYVFPIPLTEIQQSTNPQGLYQNPNY
jgi:hypothetical protein